MRFTLSLAMTFLAPLAMAQDLTTSEATDFIESLDAVNSYAESLEADVREGALEADIMPRPGEPFAPYSRSAEYLMSEHEAVYERMGEIVGDHDFSSLEDWAAVGDKVARAYIALRMEGQELGQVTPEMLQQVPEQMRPQIERMLAMIETVRNTPEADKEVVRPLIGELEDHMGRPGP